MNKLDDRYQTPAQALPNFGSNAADPQPPPDPAPTQTQQDLFVRAVLAVTLPLLYVALLVFFAVEWLNFNHPNLEPFVTTGAGILGGWAGASVFHYIGASTTNRSVMGGFALRQRR